MSSFAGNIEQLKAVVIDPEFEKVCPELTSKEKDQLEENILADGEVTAPLIVWNGILLDGHNRRRIILAHPELPFQIKEIQLLSRDAAVAWICKNQLGRRNLTEFQWHDLVGLRYKAEKKIFGGDTFYKNQYVDLGVAQNGPPPKHRGTAERLARELGIGRNTVKRAEKISDGLAAADEESPGIRRDILAGEIRPLKKEIMAIADAPEEDRPALVEALRTSESRRQAERDEKKKANRSSENTPEGAECNKPPTSSPAETKTDAAPTLNTDDVLVIIHNASLEFQAICEHYLIEFPELLDGKREQLYEAVNSIETFLKQIH